MTRVGTAASLLFCVAAVVLWVRSQWVSDVWWRVRVDRASSPPRGREVTVVAFPSGLALRVLEDAYIDRHGAFLTADSVALPTDAPWSHEAVRRDGRAAFESFEGSPNALGFFFRYLALELRPPTGQSLGRRIENGEQYTELFRVRTINGRTFSSQYGYTAVAVPWWLLSAVSGLPVGLVVRRRLRRAAEAPGRCRGCGYDLRATPDRCPECGRSARV
jgi:hypothetical protein